MFLRRWPPLALSAAAALAAACSAPPPPQPVTPAPVATPTSPPPPAPPPPKPCKALDEGCQAEDSTRAKIAGSTLVITPAKGWTYAQGESATLAQAADDGPALATAQVDVGEGKQAAEKRDAALAALAQELDVTLPKKKVNWKRPDDTKEIAGKKLGLWQREGAMRGERKGPLLIFADAGEDGEIVLGLGFVPDDDDSGADATILQSIESISVAEE
ncbi:uncharacterized protein SOCEGT47_041700 [Sorangium cellulosum]|uniref:Secreted protein n=1 Tax=Sorangium cellulosum TaxID=56 RepID=A0A4V0NDS0_SORCE|nr:hypothetical protein [Sorangium cellulosum]AUX23642.1 uncharacterized protein SOCEGT47_041700 [Sorangium cellulosum]